jgi:hypothetical protein
MHVNIFELPDYKSGPITQVSRNRSGRRLHLHPQMLNLSQTCHTQEPKTENIKQVR